MHENQGDLFEYSVPISVVLTSPGSQQVQVATPFGMDSDYIVEYIVMTTNDAAVNINADNTMASFPSNGTARGYFASGICQISPKEIWSPVSEYITINATVGASNSAISICLRFRRALVIEIPQDINHPNPAFTDS
jgi:hypothetical protein